MGKLLIIVGILCIIGGLLIVYSDRIPFLGKLPGDIIVEKENFKMYIPITTSILISILISLILYVANRWR
ncbi:MAG TPA: DUF2905 domain-containing protein [Ohtaekwangia sp.]|nr:DUF2905 domain-containing protein [Ohtaekwangia sp.]